MKRTFVHPRSDVVSRQVEGSMLVVSADIDDVGWGDVSDESSDPADSDFFEHLFE